MDRIAEFAERHGFITVESTQAALERLTLHKIVSLGRELRNVIALEDAHAPEPREPSLDPFSFLASASARGDTGCSSIVCRGQNLNVLARYSALYCDHVAIPVRLHIDPGLGVEVAREVLFGALMTVIELRPVLEARVARLFVPSLCRHCTLTLPVAVAATELAGTLALEQFSRFTVHYCPGKSAHYLRIDGPSGYVDHGVLYRTVPKTPEWLPQRLRRLLTSAGPVKLSARTLKKAKIIEGIFKTIALDVIHQQVEGTLRRPLNYLMGRRGEAEFLSRLNRDEELEARTAALCE